MDNQFLPCQTWRNLVLRRWMFSQTTFRNDFLRLILCGKLCMKISQQIVGDENENGG
jgi:hypothetical protein